MRSDTIARAQLEFKQGTSDKVYVVWVEEASGEGLRREWRVLFAYGRRGSDLQTGSKMNFTSDKRQAFKVAAETVQAKLDKGYKLAGTSTIPLNPLTELLPENILPGRPAGTFPITGALLTSDQEAQAARYQRQEESKQTLIAGATAGAAGKLIYVVVLVSANKRWKIEVNQVSPTQGWVVSVSVRQVTGAENQTIESLPSREDALQRAGEGFDRSEGTRLNSSH